MFSNENYKKQVTCNTSAVTLFRKKKIFILKSVRIKQTTKSMLLTGFFFLQHHHCLQIVFKKVYRMRYAFKYTEIKNRQTCNI